MCIRDSTYAVYVGEGAGELRYVMQRINTAVFKKPLEVKMCIRDRLFDVCKLR